MPVSPVKIFLPAAGLGERLRPVTSHIPKPLLPILGKPIIEGILEKLTAVCNGEIGINLHWKPDMIRAWAKASPWSRRITFFPEDPILGTGGALKNAEQFLTDSHFVVHNSDILLDIDFSRLIGEHFSSGNLATLACHRLPHLSNVVIDKHGQVLDVGNPATYARGVLDALRENGETVYRSTSAKCGKNEIDGYVVLEAGSALHDGAQIRNCIVMPGARVSGSHENQIIGPDYAVSLSESDMQPSLHAAEKKRVALTEPLFSRYFGAGSKPGPTEQPVWSEAILIGLGGSDRRYFRVRNDGRTAVLMECRPDDPDYERHLVYTGFFGSHTVPVPTLLSSDEATKRALFEDLGDTSLYSYMKLPHKNGHIEDVYRRVLDIAIKLHASATENISECPLLQARIFDYDHLRWETNYFLDRFVVGLKMIEVVNRHALEDELHRLAQKVDACPKNVIHRDFQRQNT